MGFENIIGNEEVKRILTKSIVSGKQSHSYLFLGPSGIGKTIFAREFAKMLLCDDTTIEGNTCNTCKSCIEFDGNNHPDYREIKPDGNTIKIEQIRMMQEKVIEKPVISKQKVYVIKDADSMTKEAQNSLLKTLEEPPEYVTIILVTANESLLLTTIKSRCTKIVFKKIEDNLLKEYLEKTEDKMNLSDTMLQIFDGSIARALSLKDKEEEYRQVERLFLTVDKTNPIDLINHAEVLYKNKEDILELLEYANLILYQQAIGNLEQSKKYRKSMEIVEKTKGKLKANANFDMCIDNLLLEVWEEINEKYSRSEV